jgi:predicted permease
MNVSLTTFLDDRRSDLRWAWRSIRRAPGASVLAALSLSLGIGANTAIFSLINALLLRSLPVRAPQELHLVASGNRNDSPRLAWNYPDYVAFRDNVKGFAGLAAGSGVGSLGIQLPENGRTGAAELVRNQFASGNYFEVLGVRPALGRLFDAGEDRVLGASPWAVLGYDYWRSRFAGDPHVIGRTVRLNGYPLTIVGVTERGFKGHDPTRTVDVYVPMTMNTEIQHVAAALWNSRHWWWFRVIGRVPAGTAAGPIEGQLTSIFKAQEEAERKTDPRAGDGNQARSLFLVRAAGGWSHARTTFEQPLIVLMAVVGLVLLIACANVANIMLARGAARQREIAVRLAVGASRQRIAVQLIVESLAIALVGGVAGVSLAYAGVRLVLVNFLPTSGWADVSLDASPDLVVLAFTLAVSVLTGLVAGVAPAWQAGRSELVGALKEDARGAAGGGRVLLRRLLVVTQVALSLLLAIGAALFLRSLVNLRALDAGFRRDSTLISFIDPTRNGYKGQRAREFYDRLRSSVESLPGVRSVALAVITPLGGSRWNGNFAVDGHQFKAGERRYADMNAVGPRYFETVGIPLLLGREFGAGDDPVVVPDPPEEIRHGPAPEAPGPRYAIVSESFARKYLQGGSPLGRRLSFTEEYDGSRAYEVVGVVKDAHYFELREAVEPMVYVSSWRNGSSSHDLCVRAGGDPAALTEAIRRAVTAIDPAVVVLRTQTIEEQLDTNIVQERLVATLAGFFGALALLLASVGLYGVISYLVARRTREIGIRLALGAQRTRVLRLVLGDVALLVGIGAAAGVAGALALARLVRSLLFGIDARDPATIAASVALLIAVTAVAVLVPVRRALAVQPSEALRHE